VRGWLLRKTQSRRFKTAMRLFDIIDRSVRKFVERNLEFL